ncbi:MAG: hypothetical protein ACREOG_19840 [Gemmatimonadaceae bacterium]
MALYTNARPNEDVIMRCLSLAVTPLLLAALSTAASAQGTSPCLPSDPLAVNMVESVKSLITSTDPGDIQLRQDAGLTNVSVSQVSLITSGTDCIKARAAVDALAGTPNSSRRVYLVKARAKRFFVRDPNAMAGEWNPALVFDNKCVFILSIADQ